MPQKVVKTLIYEIKWDDGDAQKKADAWDKKLNQTQHSSNALLDTITQMTVAFGKMAIDAVSNFASYENTLSQARRTMGLTRAETLDLADSLIALSTDFSDAGLKAGVSANELAKIAGVLGQLGFSAKQNSDEFLTLTATVAKVGTAFGISAPKAAEMLGIMQNLYDLPTADLERVASSVTVLGNSTVATAGQILDIMQRIGGVAGILGVTAQQGAAIAATMREAGVSAQVAGTAMSQIFSRLAGDVDKFAEVLGKGGINAAMLRFQIESGNATDALKSVLQAIQNINRTEGKIAAIQALKDLGLTGVRVQQSLLALSNNIAGLNTNLALSEQAFQENEAVNKAYQDAIDNTAQKMEQFWNVIDTIKKIIGQDLSLAFSDFLEKHLIPFTQHFAEWIKTSAGAKAIFGRDGLIAKGLDWIGQLLTANEQRIFDWLDAIDQVAGAFASQIRGMAGRALEWIHQNIGRIEVAMIVWKDKALEVAKIMVDAIMNIDQVLKDLQWRWQNFREDLDAAVTEIQSMWRTFAGSDANRANEIVAATAEKFLKMRDNIVAAEDAAVGNSLFPEMIEWSYRAEGRILELNNMLAQTGQIMASVSSGLGQTGFGTLDPDILQRLSQTTGVFTPQGLLGLQSTARQNQAPIAQQTGATIAQQGAALAPTEQKMTLVIEGSETVQLAAFLRTEDQRYTRRVSTGFQR